MKQYRVVEKIFCEGTKYQTSLYYPQIMDSNTLNGQIEPWEFFIRNKEENINFLTFTAAEEYIEKQKSMDIPVKTIIHPIN